LTEELSDLVKWVNSTKVARFAENDEFRDFDRTGGV